MATISDLLTQTSSAVAGVIGGSPLRYNSDYRLDLEKIQSGVTRYQVRGASAGQQFDSNTTLEIGEVAVSVHYGLPGPERTYTEGAMQTQLLSFMSRTWWRAIAAVHDVIEPPVVAVERVGKVISYTVTVAVTIDP